MSWEKIVNCYSSSQGINMHRQCS
ncbi:unnamed protein product [Victoria cruziana]